MKPAWVRPPSFNADRKNADLYSMVFKAAQTEIMHTSQTELLLSLIPSLLIGVDQKGHVSHWNKAAESLFGIPGSSVLNKPLSETGVQWDLKMLMEGIAECRKKGASIRLDEVEFKRLSGETRILGFTIIPVREESGGSVECILFGADITERKRIEELKNEFVGIVSHELRTPLTVIKEGVSQVAEGILGKVSADQKHFLSISLEGIERLGRIVDDLLDISKIEVGKLALKREMVDLVGVVKGLVLAFKAKARFKGVEIKTHLPDEEELIYVDEDRMVQVFTNLIENAIKFTEKGLIEISILNKGVEGVECSVSDTGKGISTADLPKVFGKFQQFHRQTTEKGTGLGLAICKGIIEGHKGRIWVESRPDEGTKFIFTLPRYTAAELFHEYLGKALKDAIHEESPLTVVIFDMSNFNEVQKKLGRNKVNSLILELEKLIKGTLRRRADVAIKDSRAVLVLLPATRKEQGLIVAGRIQQIFDDYLAKRKLGRQIDFTCKVATFPEDGNSEDELLKKIGGP